MKRVIFSLLLVILLATACGPAPSVSAITPPFVDTGVDSDAWAAVPAGEFPYGQHDHITMVDYDYQVMVTDVTVDQYATFLNEAIASGDISIGEFELEAGETIWSEGVRHVITQPLEIGWEEALHLVIKERIVQVKQDGFEHYSSAEVLKTGNSR